MKQVGQREKRRYRIERRLLQVIIGMTTVFPLVLGSAVAVSGITGFYRLFGLEGSTPLDPTLDSGIRFLASCFFGIGLLVLWVLPKVETRLAPFRIIVLATAFGGVMRVVSWVAVGKPDVLTQFVIVIELLMMPLTAVWQTRVNGMHRRLTTGG